MQKLKGEHQQSTAFLGKPLPFPLYCMKAEMIRKTFFFFFAGRACNNQGRRVPWPFALFLYNKWLRLHGLQSPGYEPFPGSDHIQGTVFTPKQYGHGERMSEMLIVCFHLLTL